MSNKVQIFELYFSYSYSNSKAEDLTFVCKSASASDSTFST